MSLEEALQENTKAMRELTIALTSGIAPRVAIKEEGTTDAAVSKAVAKTKKLSAPTAEEVDALTTQSPGASTAGADAASNATEPQSDAIADVSFTTARELVLKLATADKRDEVKEINAKYKLTKLGDLLSDPNDFESVKDQVTLNAVYADLLKIEV